MSPLLNLELGSFAILNGMRLKALGWLSGSDLSGFQRN